MLTDSRQLKGEDLGAIGVLLLETIEGETFLYETPFVVAASYGRSTPTAEDRERTRIAMMACVSDEWISQRIQDGWPSGPETDLDRSRALG